MAVDWFSLIDVDRYSLSFLTSASSGKADMDFQSAVDLTGDFVILESIHRLVVCLFEALCLHRGFGGRPGGATPGKYIIGLRVISCQEIVGLPDLNRVQVKPGKDIGLVGASVSIVFRFNVCTILTKIDFFCRYALH